MIRLDSTTRKLQALLAGAVTTNQLPITVCYSDKTSTAYTGGTTVINTNSGTAVDICAAPAASTVRDIDTVVVQNADTTAATLTVRYNDNGTTYTLFRATLAVGDQLTYVHGQGWRVLDSAGNTKSLPSGIALASGATLTLSGAFSTTLTATGATTLTLPTTGTLATLAGTEELDNKTLDSSVAKGTWTASGTWTLPALTLGGAITGNSQNISGLGTLGCGAITSSGVITAGTDGSSVSYYLPAGGAIRTTTASGALYIDTKGTDGGDIVLRPRTGTALTIAANGASLTTGSSITSLAFQAGNPSLNIGTGALTAGSGTFSSTVRAGTAGGATASMQLGQTGFEASISWNNGTGNLDITPRPGYTTNITAGGLAVTGTLSATGALTCGAISTSGNFAVATNKFTANATTGDVVAAGTFQVGSYIQGTEQTAPAAPSANGYRIFAQDNGAGKTQLMVIFASGAAQQIAIEP